ncbi:MAG: signal peptidase I, partial [Lachnospiraceae bacterium]|nr:signal peptidase I [Lachnospiraceae bacterium]
LVVLLAILLAGIRIVGIKPYAVLSGSMEPKYMTGSLVYVKSVDPKILSVGDDITFMLDENTVATHRIIEVIPDPDDSEVIRFRTQGIANENPDAGTVHCKNIIGQVRYTIPKLGYFANFIQHPPGTYVAIGVVVILLILVFLPDIFKNDKKTKMEEQQKKQRKTK